MKTKITVLFMGLFCQFCFCQIEGRKPLHGQVLNDSLQVSGGYVFNSSAKIKTFISPEGFFDVLAKANDTLLISSLGFKSKKIILTDKNFTVPLMIVKLESFTNNLKEVIVSKTRIPYLVSNQLMIDKPYFDDEKSSLKNITMPIMGIENGFDFIKVGRMIGDMFRKKKTEKERGDYYEDFNEAAFKAVTADFFTQTLKLKKDEIGLFLIFCENDSRAQSFVKSENKFHLIDFLITKNQEFKRIATFVK